MKSSIQAIVFKINDMFMAVNILDIERIIDYTNVSAIPDAPPYIEGVVDYEGIILPVINLKKRFNEKEQSFHGDNKIIVIEQNDFKIGVIVDSIDEIIELEKDAIERNQGFIRKAANYYIDGVAKIGERLISLLNISRISDCSSVN